MMKTDLAVVFASTLQVPEEPVVQVSTSTSNIPTPSAVTPHISRFDYTDSSENVETGPMGAVDLVVQPIISMKLDFEQKVGQKEIVGTYLKSMQQFTEALAKMNLPMDKEHKPCDSGGNDSTKLNRKESKGEGQYPKVFYDFHKLRIDGGKVYYEIKMSIVAFIDRQEELQVPLLTVVYFGSGTICTPKENLPLFLQSSGGCTTEEQHDMHPPNLAGCVSCLAQSTHSVDKREKNAVIVYMLSYILNCFSLLCSRYRRFAQNRLLSTNKHLSALCACRLPFTLRNRFNIRFRGDFSLSAITCLNHSSHRGIGFYRFNIESEVPDIEGTLQRDRWYELPNPRQISSNLHNRWRWRKPRRSHAKIIPESAQSAYDKACQYFKIKLWHVPVNKEFQEDVKAIKKYINKNTIMIKEEDGELNKHMYAIARASSSYTVHTQIIR
ncbi:C2 calcium-dependent membrane targeting [Artemisia annua]|uniref:C2 calcium-dependent membrane targeting n=1 Tax=Artemisia annua TaxID=35608 RepID=A0A2U1LPN4_ARTAN|nr:C2 calcium-dependent membrane targeting [Artemisia annua]